jgi:adenine-specific DNA-methyltransferase
VWRWSYEKLKFGLDNEFIVIKNNRIYTKTYSNATIIKENSIYKIQIEERKKNITSLDYINNIFSNDIATKEMTLLLDVKHLFSYSKPESLLQRIIEMSTTEGDIVLDFFAGSGTTPAVAHKMKRQWIAIEQMDYIQDITKLRLQKVIEGEQGGISKALNWQGGGDFIYLELAKYNQNFVDSIQNTESTQELFNLFKSQIQTQSLLNYHIETQSFLQNEADFLIQNLQDAKELLITCLNPNMLYIPNSLKQDPLYNLTQSDIQTTKNFYKEEK